MIGMAVLVETVFARPGVGSYLANAVAQKDTYAVLGAVLFVGVVVSLVNLVVDILQLMLDPRIRAAQTEEPVA
jgi:peptide/nickel transport system permease protein